ncbi:MAG: multicopper oxidase family protein [Actinomycetota bacterium]|nr:multicopper oxidase family protein [Actinomycetota bacterium]MDQ6945165.1 multicopper oxidase family protein [Actinomycetota bacterium]
MSKSISRRRFLTVAGSSAVGLAGLAACGSSATGHAIGPGSPQVKAVEAARRRSGNIYAVNLVAQPAVVDLAGQAAHTWAYSSALADPELRMRPGDTLEATVVNQVPEPTTVHWHGLAIDNAMDGVPDLTQKAIAPGASFTYRFVVPDAGTYWYHSHQGLQLDRGLYGPLVVEDPTEPGVDVDQVLVLDDWLDGIAGTPDQALASTRGGMGSMGGGMGSMKRMTSSLLGGDAGDITYPMHLINGRPPADRTKVTAPPRGKVRLRLINAGSDTAYRFAVGGHPLTVTAADGRPVQPVVVDTVLIGMGERYDVELTADSGVWPIVASAEGKGGGGAAMLRTTDATAETAPPMSARPAELDGHVLSYTDLRPVAGTALAPHTPDRSYTVDLVGNMDRYQWGLAGDAQHLNVRSGERVRITMRNTTTMYHPMHLHGHTFAVATANGVRKDTINVLPGRTQVIDFDADNPGQWMYHCHNTYHQVKGMTTTVSYRT